MDLAGRIFLQLLRSSLWEGKERAPVDLPDEPGRETWQAVYAISLRQQVTALVHEAVSRLPEHLQPPPDISLRWAVNAEASISGYRKRLRAAGDLAALFSSAGIGMMVLKGPAAARYYPEPELRQSSDLDIWLFGHYDKGNCLISSLGIPIEGRYSAKHSVFDFEGITVENHKSFLDVESYSVDRFLENELAIMLGEDGPREQLTVTGNEASVRIPVPSPTFDALFLCRHASQHFVRDMTLRQVCDWARLLGSAGKRIDRERVVRALERSGQMRFADILTDISIRYLGLSPESRLQDYRQDPDLSAKVLEDTLYPKVYIDPPSSGTTARYFNKYRRMRDSQWKYRMVYGKSAFSRTYTIFADKIRRNRRERKCP